MKLKITLSLFLAAVAIASNAQPTLTATTSIPTVGLSEVYNQNATYSAGAAGTNQNWDFSTQSFPNVSNITFEACNSSNNCSSFPGTTVVGHEGSNYIYYAGSATALSLNGLSGGGVNIPYNNPEDFLRFPFTYGNSYTDTWAATLTNSGVTFYRSGIDSVSADAWGTLKTPAGTFTNTLRVKRISTYQDSANVGGMSVIINYNETLYTWNDVAHTDVLYTTSTLISNTLGTIDTTNTSTYTGGQTAGISNASAIAKLNLHIAPNPAHDNVQIALSLVNKTDVTISISDLTGRTVYSTLHNNLSIGDNQININTSNFHSGVYLMKIVADNNIATVKLVIQ